MQRLKTLRVCGGKVYLEPAFASFREARFDVPGRLSNLGQIQTTCDGREEVKMEKCVPCRIGPSILNADLSSLTSECTRLMEAGADFLHLDVMDGHFVPNLTFGAPLVKCLRKSLPEPFFEAHMMVQAPHQWIEAMADAGVNQYTYHIEPVDDVPLLCRKVREAGMKVGLAISPETPVSLVEEYIDLADTVLIMTVRPGHGGQKFMDDQMVKVKLLREKYPLLDIEVDGGVGPSTIQACAEAGANSIVSGTAVINSPDPRAVIAGLKTVVQKSIDGYSSR